MQEEVLQVPWQKWIEKGNVPPQVSALIPVVDDCINTTKKRIIRLSFAICKHLPVVYNYVNNVLGHSKYAEEQSNTITFFDTYFSPENEENWIEETRRVFTPVGNLLAAIQSAILTAQKHLSLCALSAIDTLENQQDKDQIYMELIFQWSDAVYLMKRPQLEQENYIRSIAARFGTTCTRLGESNTFDNLDQTILGKLGYTQVEPLWLKKHIGWIESVIRVLPLASERWFENFFMAFIPLFSHRYADFFNPMACSLLEAVSLDNQQIESSLELLQPLKELDLSQFKALEKERDAIVEFGETLVERQTEAAYESLNGIELLGDSIVGARLMSSVLAGRELNLEALNILYRSRFGTSIQWHALLNSLASDFIETEVLRIYNTIARQSSMEVVGVRPGEEDEEEKQVVVQETEKSLFQMAPSELLDVMVPIPKDPSLPLNEEEIAEEAEDDALVSKSVKADILRQINLITARISLADRQLLELTKMGVSKTEDMFSKMRNTVMQIEGPQLERLFTRNFQNHYTARYIEQQKVEMRTEWLRRRLLKLDHALGNRTVRGRYVDYFKAALICIPFVILFVMILNLPTTVEMAKALIPSISFEKSANSVILNTTNVPEFVTQAKNVISGFAPPKIVTTVTQNVLPTFKWDLRAWQPLVTYVRGAAEYFKIVAPAAQFIPPVVVAETPGNGLSNLISDVVSWSFDKAYSAPVAGTVVDTVGTVGKFTKDLLARANREDAAIFNGKLFQMVSDKGILNFELAQLLTYVAEEFAWCVPLSCLFSAIHTYLVYQRRKADKEDQDAPYVVAHEYFSRNWKWMAAYVSSFVVLPAIRETIVYSGRIMAGSVVAGVGIGAAALGSPALIFLLLRYAKNKALQGDRKAEDVIRQLVAEKQIVKTAMEQVDRFSSKTINDLVKDATALTLENVGVEKQQEVRMQVTNQLLDYVKKSVPEQSFMEFAQILLSDSEAQRKVETLLLKNPEQSSPLLLQSAEEEGVDETTKEDGPDDDDEMSIAEIQELLERKRVMKERMLQILNP
jgi:hypothetical protein